MADNNKNLMPSFAQGTYAHIQKAIAEKKITTPTFIYLTDRECLAFFFNNKLNVILWDRIEAIESQMEGLVDPTTGETVPVVDYVQDSVAPVQEQVTSVTSEVNTIKEQVGNVYMLIGGEE